MTLEEVAELRSTGLDDRGTYGGQTFQARPNAVRSTAEFACASPVVRGGIELMSELVELFTPLGRWAAEWAGTWTENERYGGRFERAPREVAGLDPIRLALFTAAAEILVLSLIHI